MEEVNCAELSFSEALETCRIRLVDGARGLCKDCKTSRVSDLVGLLLSYFLPSITFLNLARITFEMYIQLFLFTL